MAKASIDRKAAVTVGSLRLARGVGDPAHPVTPGSELTLWLDWARGRANALERAALLAVRLAGGGT
jgi:hypothetical protein